MLQISIDNLTLDYSWSAYGGDDPKVTGKIDSTLLNRNEGYEILYFINSFLKKHTFLSSLTDVKKLEDLIQKAPTNIRSQENIRNWIEQEWPL
ncbi:hypothetical protein [Aquimarina rhabdastrellae]